MTEEKKEEKEELQEDRLNVKHWIIKMVEVTVALLILIYVAEIYLQLPLLRETLIAFMIVLSIGFTHEGLHYYQAVKLGYKPRWYRTKLMMGFEITHHTKRSVWMEHKKKIARLPYIFLVPISIVILIIGIYFNSLGASVAGIGSLIMHGASWFKEGVDV